METKIILTKDGSHTIAIPEMNVTYHSLHGAIAESDHVFIRAGLSPLLDKTFLSPICVFETGFGTGLNALLTLAQAEQYQRDIIYISIELFPLDAKQAASLNYCGQLNRPDLQPMFEQLHHCEWEKIQEITPRFQFLKSKTSLLNLSTLASFPPIDLIYFDTFAPAAQPELWTKEIFESLFRLAAPGAVLVTYCSKSIVRKAMQEAGFTVKKIQGPHGKREMVRAARV